MAIFRFFKSLFNRGKKKKTNKKPVRRIGRKKIKKLKQKPAKPIKKKSPKKLKRKKVKKIKKAKKVKPAIKKKSKHARLLRNLPKEKEIGVITHYFDKISVGIIKLKTPLAISEHIHIKGKNTDFMQVISSMQYNHKDITLAERGLEIGIKVNEPARENDVVYKVI
ncbi:MAG: hypothetical protein PHT53_06470 [Candidatus Omnitrophica bacterium]|nr:hypothetical protein [Candidatus Omnitrophota bacterium]